MQSYTAYVAGIALAAFVLMLLVVADFDWIEPKIFGVLWALLFIGLIVIFFWQQRQLGEDRNRLKAVVENLIDGTITFGEGGDIIGFDDDAAQVFGYAPGEILGQSINLLMPDLIDGPQNRLNANDAAKLGVRLEVTGRRSDGNEFPIDLVINTTGPGSPSGFTALVCDISEHQLFDLEIKQRVEQLEAAFAERSALLEKTETLAHLGHWSWEIERGDIYWSAELYRILGRDATNTTPDYATYVESIVHPDDRETIAAAHQRALQDPAYCYHGNHRILLPSGEERLVYERTEVLRDDSGKATRMMGMVQDISLQKGSASDKEFLESLALQAEKISAIGHFLYDEIEERYLYSSPGCARIYGMTEQDYLNHYTCEADDLSDIHEQDRARVVEAYGQHDENGGECSIEFRIYRADGEIRWLRELLVAHQMKAGRVAVSRGVIQDITEQKAVEMELREAKRDLEDKIKQRTRALAASEERFQLAMRGSSDGLWDWNLVTDEVYYSRRWFEMLGYDQTDWPNTLNTWEQLVNPDDRARVHAEVEAYIEQKTAEFRCEFSMKHRDGHWVPILSRAAMQLDPDSDTLLRLVGTNLDLSHQKAAEARLQSSEARIRALVSNIPGVVYSCYPDSTRRMSYVSDYMEALTSYPSSDFIGNSARSYQEIIHLDDRAMVESEVQAGISTTGSFEIEYRIVDRHGEILYVWERGQIIRNDAGEPTHLDGFIFDISDRVQAEHSLTQINLELDDRIRERTAELDQSKKIAFSLMNDAKREKRRAEESFERLQESTAQIQKLQQAVEQSPLSIVISDTDGIIEYANAFASQISQYSNADLIGSSSNIVRSDQHSDDFYRDLDHQLSQGRAWSGELCNRKKDGTLYWESTSMSPVSNSEGEVVNTVSVKMDITEQRKMQDALIEAKEQAEAANRAKSSFLAMMSHEIRTPMNGIVGMIDLLNKTSLDDKQQRFSRVAQASALSLLQIINDILDFSKIEAGHMEVESIPVAWVSIVEDVVEVLAPSVWNKNLQLSCLVDARMPQWVSGDPGRLRQILINLLGNAIKFTESSAQKTGEIQLMVTTDDGSGSRHLRVEVSDNGIGMTEQQVSGLFQPFTQADSSTHRRFGGTGLGLSICSRLVNIMGGEIVCNSEVGVGTSFSVKLPCDPTEAPVGAEPGTDLARLNIMLLGDKPILDSLLLPDLETHDAIVTRLAEPEAALETALAANVDVILLHADWPEQDQISLAESIRQDPQLQACGLVVLTPKSRTEVAGNFPDCILARSNPFVATEVRNAIGIAAGRAEAGETEDSGEDEVVSELPTPDQAEANGRLILVVEDNLTNQDVIQHQLNLLGYVGEVANHGLEALERLAQRRYGLILTDCDMPEMDGYELTATIREQELETDSRLPIIAITANALLGESDRCLAAGMDDYLSKPVALAKLKKMMQRWMPQRKSDDVKRLPCEHRETEDQTMENNSANDQTAPAPAENPVIDRNLLSEYLSDDEQIQDMFLHKFVTQSESVVAAVNAAVNDEAWDEVGAQAHKLKSSSRSIGAVQLSDICAELEQAGKSADAQRVKELSPQLGEAYGQVREYVEAQA